MRLTGKITLSYVDGRRDCDGDGGVRIERNRRLPLCIVHVMIRCFKKEIARSRGDHSVVYDE